MYTPQIPRYCARYSVERDGAVLLCSPYCIAEGCIKTPTFGVAGDRHALFCTEHAREHPEIGLVNLRVRKCEVKSCSTQPVFGFSADRIRIRCKAHSLPGMINVAHAYCEDRNKRIRSVGYKFDNDKVSSGNCYVQWSLAERYSCCRHSHADVARVRFAIATYRE
jgi:EsV-1-7 cysteine-rich motif